MKIEFNLYLITDRKQTKLPLLEAIRRALQGGVRAVQLREKDLPIRELLSLAMDLRDLTKEFGARLFINDRVDVAVAIEADGVHLGHQSMPADAVRKIVGDKMLIGVSTHTLEEAMAAEKTGADFVTFSPVYLTPSKVHYGPPAGTAALRTVKQKVRIPVFGLGGITYDKAAEVMRAGADGLAMISAIFAAGDVKKAAEDMNRRIGETEKR